MEQLIPIASKLQDVFGALGQNTTIDLPQVVVIGSQSSGKSSVLEAMVGRSFLPRGTGICTRRPLVLQLYNTDSPTDANHHAVDKVVKEEDLRPGDEWGEFLHLPGKRFYDFTEIRAEIVRETDRSTGTNKGISSQAIHLKVYSPRVLHLTMVDLPGITKVAVGDQPEDIEVQIRAMCLNYITNPNAIILAVTAGNTDLANSDALQMARSVDPEGKRTIGVITKLDLMDHGTDAVEILQNRVVPLRRGYIAVMNRGQADIVKDVSIRQGLKKEAEFFRSHPAYRHLQHKCGTVNLAKSLNGILMHHIRDCLPEIKNRILSMMSDIQRELESLGSGSTDTSRAALGAEMLRLLSKFSSNFSDCIAGRGSSADGVEMNELYGGARVSFIFNDIFVSSLMAVDPFDGLSDEEIRTTICNANGPRPALFVPEISFDLLIRRQISRLEQPGLQCVDLVFDELQRMSSQCEPNEFQRFPNLRERMVEVVSSLLRRCVSPTQLMISNLVKIELAYINTSHPDFIGGSRAVGRLMEKINDERNGPSPQIRRGNHSSGDNKNQLSSADLSSNFDGENEDIEDEERENVSLKINVFVEFLNSSCYMINSGRFNELHIPGKERKQIFQWISCFRTT